MGSHIPSSGGTRACWLFSCIHNPPNSDMDYWIFNVRTWSFVCARMHTGGLGTPTVSQHNLFDSENLKRFACALDGIQTFDLWISTEPTRHPKIRYVSGEFGFSPALPAGPQGVHRGTPHRQRVSTTCLTRKNSPKNYCAPFGFRTLDLWTPTLHTTEPTRQPRALN